VAYNGCFTVAIAEHSMTKQKVPRRFGGLTIIQTMTLLAILGVALFFALSLFKKEAAPSVTFKTLNGELVTTASLKGKVVLVNFWATSCSTCIAEMPDMVETYKKYQANGLELVAVAMSYDPPNYVLNYAETRELPFKVALDADGSAAKSFGDVKLTPTTFLIDKEGNIVKRYVGKPEFPALHQLIEKSLSA
jgi:peroxiredoxin